MESLEIKDRWIIDGDSFIYTADINVFTEGNIKISEEIKDALGIKYDGDRIVLFFEGREYPCFYKDSDRAIGLGRTLQGQLIGTLPDFDRLIGSGKGPTIKLDLIDKELFGLHLVFNYGEISLKQQLFDYLGYEGEIGNFADSNEIVFLKAYLQHVDTRWRTDAFMVSAVYQKFYVMRLKDGKEQDPKGKSLMDNPTALGLDGVLSHLLENVYPNLRDKNIMLMSSADEHFYFSFTPKLIEELVSDDVRLMIELLDTKLDYYFSRFDGPGLAENFVNLMENYADYYNRDFRYSFKDLVTDEIPRHIEGLPFFDTKLFKAKGYVGEYTWAEIPEISIQDKHDHHGFGIRYFLNKETPLIYLALYNSSEDNNEELRGKINPISFNVDIKKIKLSDEVLRDGILCYKEYVLNHFDDAEIEDDLKLMVEVYDKAVRGEFLEKSLPEELAPEVPINEEELPEVSTQMSMDTKGEEDNKIQEEKAIENELEETDDDKNVENAEIWVNEEVTESTGNERADKTRTVFIAEEKESKAIGIIAKKKIKAPKHKKSKIAGLECKKIIVESEVARENVKEISDIKGAIHQITQYINGKGYPVGEEIVQNLYLSLKAYPSVILTGLNGLGKGHFAKLFAEAMGINSKNRRFKHIFNGGRLCASKQANTLLGAIDANGFFIPGGLLIHAKRAMDTPDRPFLLLIDELFSAEEELNEILSKRTLGNDVPMLNEEAFGRDTEAKAIYQNVVFPDNLFMISTYSTNISHSAISSQTIGQNNIIEIESLPILNTSMQNVAPIIVDKNFLKASNALALDKNPMLKEVVILVEAMNSILLQGAFNIGAKRCGIICDYLRYNAEFDLMSQGNALDCAILQNIIIRIAGEKKSIPSVINDLFKICAGTREEEAVNRYTGGGLFPKSAGKLSKMHRGFTATGKADFWE